MKKAELAAAVSERTDMTKQQAVSAVDAVFDAISDALMKGEEVRVPNFGNFTIAQRAAGTGRNPQTGEPINIRASKQVKFKAGKGLKDSMNPDAGE